MRGTAETVLQSASRIIPNKLVSTGRRRCPRFLAQSQLPNPDTDDAAPHTTRRTAALSLATVTLSGQLSTAKSLAEEGRRFWLDGLLDTLPPASNKINNEETGTRSFLKQGIYMAKVGPKGSAYRLKKTAFDLLGMGDIIDQDAWGYIRKYLRLKSTFMYYDFDKVITAAPADEKEGLTNLANRLFDNLEVAIKSRSVPQTKSCYEEISRILEEVMAQMA
ncbi:Photosynthetic NDH subunit of lumenal location 3 [Nymphaea thermarum]|nr:Photosynthetic NDH subunit of lumenal location 3 [Nymphaea thermarum]